MNRAEGHMYISGTKEGQPRGLMCRQQAREAVLAPRGASGAVVSLGCCGSFHIYPFRSHSLEDCGLTANSFFFLRGGLDIFFFRNFV